MKRLTTKVKLFTNLQINSPDKFINSWHGDFGYSTDGKFFTHQTIFGESQTDVQSKVETYLNVKFKPEQIIVK